MKENYSVLEIEKKIKTRRDKYLKIINDDYFSIREENYYTRDINLYIVNIIRTTLKNNIDLILRMIYIEDNEENDKILRYSPIKYFHTIYTTENMFRPSSITNFDIDIEKIIKDKFLI